MGSGAQATCPPSTVEQAEKWWVVANGDQMNECDEDACGQVGGRNSNGVNRLPDETDCKKHGSRGNRGRKEAFEERR